MKETSSTCSWPGNKSVSTIMQCDARKVEYENYVHMWSKRPTLSFARGSIGLLLQTVSMCVNIDR